MFIPGVPNLVPLTPTKIGIIFDNNKYFNKLYIIDY